MNFNNNITNNLHDAIEFSNGERERLGDIQIFPNHIVLGLMRLNDCSALNILIKLGIDLNTLKKKLEEIKNDNIEEQILLLCIVQQKLYYY